MTHPLDSSPADFYDLFSDIDGPELDAWRQAQAFAAAGAPQRALRAIGHPLRGVAWESSSIPEQRAQATALAARLLAELQPATAAAAE